MTLLINVKKKLDPRAIESTSSTRTTAFLLSIDTPWTTSFSSVATIVLASVTSISSKHVPQTLGLNEENLSFKTSTQPRPPSFYQSNAGAEAEQWENIRNIIGMEKRSKVDKKSAFDQKLWMLLDNCTHALIFTVTEVASNQLQYNSHGFQIKTSIPTGDLEKISEEAGMYKIEVFVQVRLLAPKEVGVPTGNTDLQLSDTSFFQAFHIRTKINKNIVEIIYPIKFTKNVEIGLVMEKFKDSMIILFMDRQLEVEWVGLLRKEVEKQEEAFKNSSKTISNLEWATRKHQPELEISIAQLRLVKEESGGLAVRFKVPLQKAHVAETSESGQTLSVSIASSGISKNGIVLISQLLDHGNYAIKELALWVSYLHQMHLKTGVLVKRVAPWRRDSDAWKLILTELFQALTSNGCRGKASLKVDGDVETGFAVCRVNAMGTEEYGLGSVKIGCAMACKCHTNNCQANLDSHQGGSVHFASMNIHLVNYFSHDDEMVSSTRDQREYTKKGSMSMRFHTWFLEKLKKKAHEVLPMFDAINEYTVGHLKEREGKKLVSATKEGLKFQETEEKHLKQEYPKKLEEILVYSFKSLMLHLQYELLWVYTSFWLLHLNMSTWVTHSFLHLEDKVKVWAAGIDKPRHFCYLFGQG